MKAFKSCTHDEIKTKFKPIKVNVSEWTLGPSVKQILHQKTTSSGHFEYVVKLKDSQVIKVSKENLSKNYANLIRQFHIQSKRQQKKTDNVLPAKRGRLSQRSAKRSKRVRSAEEPGGEIDELDADSDADFQGDDSDSEGSETSSSSSQTDTETSESKTITSHGRKTMKPRSFLSEFYSDLPKASSLQAKANEKTHFGPVHKIPLYEDESFIEHHSEYCFQCHKKGTINGTSDSNNTDVYIGRDNARNRLLLCNYCSLSFHNNCVSLMSTSFDKETQSLKCQKCAKLAKCPGCDKGIHTKEDSTALPFRCSVCFRGFHQDCVILGTSSALKDSVDESKLVETYQLGKCVECNYYANKSVETILAERYVDDKLEYFVKWKDLSFRKAEWVSENWISQAYSSTHRGYNTRKAKGKNIPYSDEWLMIDRILDVKWEDRTTHIARKVLAVFKDRDYGEACWDDPPSEEESALYAGYQKALKRYIQTMDVAPPRNMKALIKQVRSEANTEEYESHELKSQPAFVTGGKLMKHQMEALNWLLYQWEKKKSCVLADDMGLGKTIQIITFLYYLFKKYGVYPFYIVVPNSTATNWIREFEKWAPEMAVAPYFGGKKSRKLACENEIFDSYGRLKCHAVVATYESALENTLTNVFWPVLIVDESQRLKNDNSLLFKHLRRMQTEHTVLLTGTPLQNNLRELFNIMHFVHPELFVGREAEQFEELTKKQVEELHGRLRPFFLRRTKEQVLKSLPPRYEMIVPVSMTTLQKEVYKQCLSGEIQETLAQVTKAKRQAGLTNIFVNLRKLLNHPYLLDGVETPQSSPEDVQKNMINASAKLKLFHQMLPKLIERGHRLLIFSTMTRTLDVLEDYFHYENIQYARIDGSTMERDRVRRIDAFNAADSQLKVFLLSTRAGGVGINLATADTVIIWDSDFNPYADLQAIGRAHRIGQTKMVLIYRLMTRLSVEEKVLQIAKRRMALEHVIVERMAENEEDNLEDIESILKYGTEALFSDDTSKDIVYDDSAIENLLDREQYRETAEDQKMKEVEEMEEKANEKGAMNFSFAKVWKSNGATEELGDDTGSAEEQKDVDFWEKFLIEQQTIMEKKKEEKRLEEMRLGRGARKRNAVKYTENKKAETKRDENDDESDKEFVDEHGASDSEFSNDGEHFNETMSELASLGIQGEAFRGTEKENAPHPTPDQTHNTLNVRQTPEDVLRPLGVHRLSEAEKKKLKELEKIRQKQLRDMNKALRYYSDSMYGILISYIDKDLRHVQGQAEQSVADHSFGIELFNRAKANLLTHIQESITQFSIKNAEREREADIKQSNIDPTLANEAFEGKKRIILRNVERTTEYIFTEFEKMGKYLTGLVHIRDEKRRDQLHRLKTEIQKLKAEEERFKEKHRIEERLLESRNKQQIMQLANMFNIYPDGIPPNQITDIDAAADRLIRYVLGTDTAPNSSNPGSSSGQPIVINNEQQTTQRNHTVHPQSYTAHLQQQATQQSRVVLQAPQQNYTINHQQQASQQNPIVQQQQQVPLQNLTVQQQQQAPQQNPTSQHQQQAPQQNHTLQHQQQAPQQNPTFQHQQQAPQQNHHPLLPALGHRPGTPVLSHPSMASVNRAQQNLDHMRVVHLMNHAPGTSGQDSHTQSPTN